MTADPAVAAATCPAGSRLRCRVAVRGVVQGVGFRPFLFALAAELGLSGHVANTGTGVVAEVEGETAAVASFCDRIAADAPPLAVVESVTRETLAALGTEGFTIDGSRTEGPARTLVSPDAATCDACLAELCDPDDRRHRHPFISCAHCGPRFTIVTGLPYDRANTTMAGFPMCERCAREYADPADRRFHAQPLACHDCGPRLRLYASRDGGVPEEAPGDPVTRARRLLTRGAVLAVKGLGGYHLACDATNPGSVRLLRRRKACDGRPFALMARDPADIEPLVRIGPGERELLTGPHRPTVLLRRRPAGERPPDAPAVADEVAPGCADLGVMLPYTPLHHLLLGLPGDRPGPRLLVMTSGNTSGERIVTDDEEALERLAPLADVWLTHDRPIHAPCDDSVFRVVDGTPLPVRRSRGYAPLPVPLPVPVTPALAVGGDLANTCCLGEGRHAWLSAHIGDLAGPSPSTRTAFGTAERRLEELTGVAPRLFATDLHPGLRSSGWARRHAGDRPVRAVQHHHAHLASVMAEAGLDGSSPVIGVAFDGTGYGDDGTEWGGEFLLADYDGYRRFAHLASVPLPEGDAAVRRPWRTALAHLRAAGLDWAEDLPPVAAGPPGERETLAAQLERGPHCVPTSSMGRLFDAVSSLAGICHHAGYEAQAAVELEAAAYAHGDAHGARHGAGPGEGAGSRAGFALGATPDGPLVADPAPVLAAAVEGLRRGAPAGLLAARFHDAVVRLVRQVCAAARDRYGLGTVALSGGVFANGLLAGACTRGLRADGFTVLTHRLVPPNDGGLALGQLVIAARTAAGAP